jgi:hypothetical protein
MKEDFEWQIAAATPMFNAADLDRFRLQPEA